MIRRSVWLAGLILLEGCTSNRPAPVYQAGSFPRMDPAFGKSQPRETARKRRQIIQNAPVTCRRIRLMTIIGPILRGRRLRRPPPPQ